MAPMAVFPLCFARAFAIPLNILYFRKCLRSTVAGELSPMADSYSAPESSHRYVLDGVRESDRDRFLAALFAPEPARRALLALLAFDHELARTSTVTREPMLARIRLQWWREAVAEAPSIAKPRAQPIVGALSGIMRPH